MPRIRNPVPNRVTAEMMRDTVERLGRGAEPASTLEWSRRPRRR